MSEPTNPTPAEPKPAGDEVVAAWLSAIALLLVGGLLLAIPVYSILALAWSVVSGATRLPLERGATHDVIMSLVFGFFGVFMLRVGVRMVQRQRAPKG